MMYEERERALSSEGRSGCNVLSASAHASATAASAEASAAAAAVAKTSAAAAIAATADGRAGGRGARRGCCACGGVSLRVARVSLRVARVVEACGIARCEGSFSRNATALHIAARGCAALSETARRTISGAARSAVVAVRCAADSCVART